MKRDNTPQETLLLLIALAAEHVQHGRYSYAVTALSVALELVRKLAGEGERKACPDCKVLVFEGENTILFCPAHQPK